MHPFRQRLRMPMPTTGAILRCVGRIHPDHCPTSVCCFVGKKLSELRPGRVMDALSQTTIMHHPTDRQIFHSHHPEAIDQLVGLLMGKIPTPIAYSFVDMSNDTLLLSALSLSQGFFVGAKEARIANLLPRRKDGEVGQPHINAYPIKTRGKGRKFDITGDAGEPFARSRARDRAGLGGTLQEPVLYDPDLTDLGNTQSFFAQLPTRLREAERIVPILSPEAWVTRLLSSLAATEESLKRQVNSYRHILQHLRMNQRQGWTLLFERRECALLGIQPQGLLMLLPGSLSLLQEVVVQPAAFFQDATHRRCLFLGRIQAIFEGFTHGHNIRTNQEDVKGKIVSSTAVKTA